MSRLGPVLHTAGPWANAGVQGPLGPSDQLSVLFSEIYCFAKMVEKGSMKVLKVFKKRRDF